MSDFRLWQPFGLFMGAFYACHRTDALEVRSVWGSPALHFALLNSRVWTSIRARRSLWHRCQRRTQRGWLFLKASFQGLDMIETPSRAGTLRLRHRNWNSSGPGTNTQGPPLQQLGHEHECCLLSQDPKQPRMNISLVMLICETLRTSDFSKMENPELRTMLDRRGN